MLNFELDRSEVAKRLQETRKKHNLSRDALSNRLDVSRSTLQLYESGERMPTADILWRYYVCFGVNIHWLITGEEENISSHKLEPHKEILLEQVNGMPDEIINRLIDLLISIRRN